MAESAVCLLIDKLVLLLAQEVELLSGIDEEIADIKDELESIRAFLKDADVRAEKEEISGGVKAWVKQVREAANRIEDAIDQYILHVAQHHVQCGLRGFLNRITSCGKSLKMRHEMASVIQNLKTSLGEIKERSERYKFNTSEQAASSNNVGSLLRHDPRLGSLFIKENELVGVESFKDELISQLVEGAFQRVVISVVGMGGIGKTTLVKNVYDHQRVVDYFDCQAWIIVSRSYKREQLLRSIIKQFHEARKEPFPRKFQRMDYMMLIAELNKYLRHRRYLVAFDDIWEIGFWEDIQHALFDNNKGSRIIITTRNKDVAHFCKSSSIVDIHEMKPLPQDKAWELFCKRAFQFEFDGHCPEELKELALDVLKRCGGLPLAIVVVGGLLASKEKVVAEWQKLRDSLSSELLSNPHLEKITKILSLSYSDLPYYLKSCFLYFGMFPEDYSISHDRLIRFWIAEGFVEGKQGMTVEEVAEQYMVELIHRSLVQMDDFSSGETKRYCRVHDMIHEVIISKSKELGYHQVSKNHRTFEGIARHLSICDTGNNSSSSTRTNTQTRSVMIFNGDDMPMPLICTIFKKFKLLKVLEFQGAPIKYIPEELGNLLHLRYFGLRYTQVKILPKSIRKLHNLETLDVRDNEMDGLQVEISSFPKLRHLFAYSFDYSFPVRISALRGLKIQGHIGILESLQTLYTVDMDRSMHLLIELGRLKQLRKLGIRNLKSEDGIALCSALENMIKLRSLALFSTGNEELLQLQSLSSPPPLLHSIRLFGPLERFPSWILKLKSLVKFCLVGSRLMDDPFVVLQALPNLIHLTIFDAFNGEQLHFREGGFKKLKAFNFGGLNRLNSLMIDEGALPCLKFLAFGPFTQLKEVPSTIKYLTNLKTLHFMDMPKEFAQRTLPDEGQDSWIVKHIPSVNFMYTIEERRQSYKLGDPEFVEYLQS